MSCARSDTGGPVAIIDRGVLDELIAALRRRGYTVIGPQVRSRSIVFDEMTSAADLPAGWVDDQEGGTLPPRAAATTRRVRPRRRPRLAQAVPVPAAVAVWRARRGDDGGLEVRPPAVSRRYAFVGVRSCDLHAVAIQDRVFLGDRYVEPDYEARRRDAFFVAVNCGRAGGTCFCASMGTGPRVTGGFDLALTEMLDDDGHRFLVEVGSERGADVLAEVRHRPARRDEREAASDAVERTRGLHGPHARHDRRARAAAGQPRAPALGRGRRALPELRQLHARVPDVLLQLRSRTRPTSPASRPSTRACGTRASRSSTPTCTAAACAARDARATASG